MRDFIIFEPTGDRIIDEVMSKHNVRWNELIWPNRSMHLIRARREIWYRLRVERGWSFPRIAGLFNRHHTTIMHGVRLFEQEMRCNEKKILRAPKNDAMNIYRNGSLGRPDHRGAIG